jgi:tRNA threonylcarbamoyladenosine biosynthesis protein TsaE
MPPPAEQPSPGEGPSKQPTSTGEPLAGQPGGLRPSGVPLQPGESMQLTSTGEDETIALGRQIAAMLPPRAAVLLIGNLGAGKTTLAKGIVAGLGAAAPEEVSSPTFTLIHEFAGSRPVYHIDLYRLDTPEEVASLGLDDLFDQEAVVLVEWGERFPRLMPPGRIEIRLRAPDPQSDEREIEITKLS